jgi:hypothetical protein
MIYDAGLLGTFLPFTLYYLKNNNLMELAAIGEVVKFPLQRYGIKALRSNMDGSAMVCADLMTHDPPVQCDAYQYNFATGSFSFLTSRPGYAGMEVFSNIVKLYGEAKVTLIGGVNRIVELVPSNSPILSRDAFLYYYYSGAIWINNGDNTWSSLITDSQPVRVQKVGTDYYYGVGAVLKDQNGAVITFDDNIVDFYISTTESVVLTTDGVFWLDGSFNIVAQAALVGVGTGSMLTMAGGFLAINLSSKIVIFLGHNLFHEVAAATSFVAIMSNNN